MNRAVGSILCQHKFKKKNSPPRFVNRKILLNRLEVKLVNHLRHFLALELVKSLLLNFQSLI